MLVLNDFIENLHVFLVGKKPREEDTIIKMHTRSLEDLGDLSFPILAKNWYHFIDKSGDEVCESIFKYKVKENSYEKGLNKLVEESKRFGAVVRTYKIIKSSAHLFLERPYMFSVGISRAVSQAELYGKDALFPKIIKVKIDDKVREKNINDGDLTTLRLIILGDVTNNLINLVSISNAKESVNVSISLTNLHTELPNIICGPVLNENGQKDCTNTAADLFNKRTSDMRMMAQHRYRLSLKANCDWNQYFSTLGRASATIEMLSNKPHKSIKIALNDLSGSNKGPSFIFYNCARLSVLLKEFDKKVDENVYPELPELDKIDFTLLNKTEEWELLYVYVIQFPCVTKNCIKSIEKGIINPQHLITFLSNLSSVFSIYYRRIRILTDPRSHLFATIHAKIYLLKAVQNVFHNALKLLNIEPVSEM